MMIILINRQLVFEDILEINYFVSNVGFFFAKQHK